MTKTLRPVLALLLLLVAASAEASVNAFWKELAGSATGGAVSQLTPPAALGPGVGVAAGTDGKPIVVYTVSPVGEDGTILAKRWTGTAWQLFSPATGINTPSINGENPQIVISPAGTVYVAWSTREPGGGQVHLRRRTATGTLWEQLGGSDAPGGLTSVNGSSATQFSLAVGDDDLPVVAFATVAQKPGIGFPVPGNVTGQPQIYVKKYMGAAQGWQYLGSDPFGSNNTSAGGASEAVSFLVNGSGGYAQHRARTPSLVIDDAGRPTVAFVYDTSYPFGSGPEFVAGNSEIFVTRFDNGAWGPVGPAVPTGDGIPGQGGAGGVSNNTLESTAPSLTVSAGGVLWIAWEEGLPANGGAIFVRRWNGTDTWEEVGGASASGGGIAGANHNGAPQIRIDSSELPIVAWQNFFSAAAVFVARFDGTDWVEMGPDSASGDGISGLQSSPMALGVSSGTPSTVNVAWLGVAGGSSTQARLRQFFNGPSFPLSVGINPSGSGEVVSTPIGIDCPTDSCSELYPTGTIVNLTPIAGPDTLFDKWTGACIGSAACNVTMTAARSLNASFVPAATLTVARSGLGTVTGTGIACGADCDQRYRLGTIVTLTATMPVGTLFNGWGGACAFRGTNTTCPLTMQSNITVNAVFSQRVYGLGVGVGTPTGTVGQGSVGNVIGAGGGAGTIACGVAGGICSAGVDHGTRVILSALSAPGNRFMSWVGAPCAGRTNATCDFSMVANYTVSAQFRGVTGLTVSKGGNGTGVVTGPLINCGTDCVGEAFTNTSAVFKAMPAVSSVIQPAGGACTWTPTGLCSFTASGLNQTVTATFTLRRFGLTVTGEGIGYTTSADGGIDCGSVPGHIDCTETYDYGTVVALTPFPGVDSMFVSWTGCSRLNGSVCLVDMTANHTVHKKFTAAKTLTLSASGNGHGRLLVPGRAPILCTGCSGSFLLPLSSIVPTLVTATPDVGSNFQWLAGTTVSSCIGKSTPCPVVMSQNQSVVGAFSLNRQSLVVTNRANGSVTATFGAPDPFDLLCGSGDNQCSTVQDYGTLVNLQATADAGNVFVNWTGTSPCGVGANATNPICSFPLRGNVTVIPNFRARTLVTLLKAGNGVGTVTGPGLSCGADCGEAEFDGKPVTLTATPAVGSQFGGFAGACVSSGPTCTFTPAGNNQSVSATFTLRRFVITATSDPAGFISNPFALPDDISCGGIFTDCTATLDYGTPVILEAQPDQTHVFVKWLGTVCVGSTNSTCSFKVGLSNITVTPTYRLRTTVQIMKDGQGQGTVVSTPVGLNCLPSQNLCSGDFFDGKPVTLKATPAVGSRFFGFSDACTSANATCTYTPAGEIQTVHAEFELIPLALNVTSRNQGVVTSFPLVIDCGLGDTTCSAVYDYGTSVHLFASPDTGYAFLSWTGVVCAAGHPSDECVFTITANTTVTPSYRRATVVVVQRDGDGTGTVTGVGINCGIDCTETIFDGKSLTLTAKAATGSKFSSWTGSCAGFNTSVCTFTPTGDQDVVTAVFDPLPETLTVTINGPGTVNGIAPPCTAGTSPCVYQQFFGQQLVLQAAADPTGQFVSWTGCPSPSGTSCTVLMNANKSVTATFQPQ